MVPEYSFGKGHVLYQSCSSDTEVKLSTVRLARYYYNTFYINVNNWKSTLCHFVFFFVEERRQLYPDWIFWSYFGKWISMFKGANTTFIWIKIKLSGDKTNNFNFLSFQNGTLGHWGILKLQITWWKYREIYFNGQIFKYLNKK